jgi:pyruvate/2-oxoglutarate dehydrogenase complex dihydrolipoamide acyltransferase (E2) component
MSEATGQTVPLSLGRRIICDFLNAGKRVPTVSICKDMNVAALRDARQSARPRPSWCSIFTKAYAGAVAVIPDLRRAYLSFPWERLYEYRHISADITMDVPLDGEQVIVGAPLQRPESLPLLEIDRLIAWHKEKPLERLRNYRRAQVLARLPRLVRRLAWWYVLSVSGYRRSRYFGTFGVTSVSNWGVEAVTPIAPVTSVLHYGTIDARGTVAMRVTFDHRVMDGSKPARALAEMERILDEAILAELRTLRGSELRKAG